MACGNCENSQNGSTQTDGSGQIYPSLASKGTFCNSCFIFWVAIAIVSLLIISKKSQ